METDLRPNEGENNLLDTILYQRTEKFSVRMAIKAGLAVACVVLAILIPQLVHLIAGQNSGVKWMPMFFPILLAGCLFGYWWGLGIGAVSPIVSFLITSIWKKPMPSKYRLGFMVPEAAAFGLVSGLFSTRIAFNKWFAFPAVLFAQLIGIILYIIICAIFQSVAHVPIGTIWNQVQAGMIGVFIQAIIVPVIVILITYLIKHEVGKGSKIEAIP